MNVGLLRRELHAASTKLHRSADFCDLLLRNASCGNPDSLRYQSLKSGAKDAEVVVELLRWLVPQLRQGTVIRDGVERAIRELDALSRTTIFDRVGRVEGFTISEQEIAPTLRRAAKHLDFSHIWVR